MSGRGLFNSIMMLIPEPYIYDTSMPQQLKDFYIYHENHIEPWDGPAALVFTDGDIVGAKLDRNGLRPRYTLGMNYWFGPMTVLKFAYQFDHNNGGVGHNAWLMQFATGF